MPMGVWICIIEGQIYFGKKLKFVLINCPYSFAVAGLCSRGINPALLCASADVVSFALPFNLSPALICAKTLPWNHSSSGCGPSLTLVPSCDLVPRRRGTRRQTSHTNYAMTITAPDFSKALSAHIQRTYNRWRDLKYKQLKTGLKCRNIQGQGDM